MRHGLSKCLIRWHKIYRPKQQVQCSAVQCSAVQCSAAQQCVCVPTLVKFIEAGKEFIPLQLGLLLYESLP